MSIDILEISPNKSVSKFIKIFSMDTKSGVSLADFVRTVRNKKNLSTTQVEMISKQGGAKGISDGYISQIETGYIKNVSPEKLKALAKGLGISDEEIFASARGIEANKEIISNERFAMIAEGYSDLPEQARENLEPLLTAIELTIMKESKPKATINGKTKIKAKASVETPAQAAKSKTSISANATNVRPQLPINEKLNFSGTKSRKKQTHEQTLIEEMDAVIENKKSKK